MKLLVEIYKLVMESYQDWSSDNWVHFSDVNYLKLTMNRSARAHNDLVGIYLFPEKFEPHPYWRAKKYKFIVKVDSGLRVLDISNMTDELANDLMGRMGVEPASGDVGIVQFWRTLNSLGSSKANKFIRNAGYDAIFDDTKTLHSKEIQLIVLDPRKVEVVDVQSNAVSVFSTIKTWYDKILAMLTTIPSIRVIEQNEPVKRRYGSGYKTSSSIYFKSVSDLDGYESYGISISNVTDDGSVIVFSPTKNLYGNPSGYSVIWSYDPVVDHGSEVTDKVNDFIERVKSLNVA